MDIYNVEINEHKNWYFSDNFTCHSFVLLEWMIWNKFVIYLPRGQVGMVLRRTWGSCGENGTSVVGQILEYYIFKSAYYEQPCKLWCLYKNSIKKQILKFCDTYICLIISIDIISDRKAHRF